MGELGDDEGGGNLPVDGVLVGRKQRRCHESSPVASKHRGEPGTRGGNSIYGGYRHDFPENREDVMNVMRQMFNGLGISAEILGSLRTSGSADILNQILSTPPVPPTPIRAETRRE